MHSWLDEQTNTRSPVAGATGGVSLAVGGGTGSGSPEGTPGEGGVGRGMLRDFAEGTSAATEFYSPMPEGYRRGYHRYVAVLGTVMSGLGKGIFASSLAKLLKDKGLSVAPIKMEGYLNIDSGTLNPYRHGEVFVLDDGTECDMDLGTYERMLDQNLTRANFTTSGQIYSRVLDGERKGIYLGRDVQMIPHVTGEVKRTLRELAMRGGEDGGPADVVFVEVGGTVGDYENGFYIEALRELAFEEGPGCCSFVALTYIIEPQALGEQKSKAAQLGIKRLMEAGIQPQLIACRATHPVARQVREKIAMFSNVPLRRVFSLHDRSSVYSIPHEMRHEGLDREILSLLNLHDRVDTSREDRARDLWSGFIASLTAPKQRRVRVGVTGKYANLRDAYASIDKALEHASVHLRCGVDIAWIDTTELDQDRVADRLDGFDAVIVPGGFGERGVAGKLACVRYCRENAIPYLGICLGFQVAVIEFARNVLGLADAYSTEFDPDCQCPVIAELPDQKQIEGLGGTMRLGAQDVVLTPGSLASFLHEGAGAIRERFRHRYEVEPRYIERLEAHGLLFSGRHPSQPIMQVLEVAQPGTDSHDPGDDAPRDHPGPHPETDDATHRPVRITHPFFIAAQFHPELTSRPLRPQPLFMGLIAAALDRRYSADPEWAELRGSPVLARWLGRAHQNAID